MIRKTAGKQFPRRFQDKKLLVAAFLLPILQGMSSAAFAACTSGTDVGGNVFRELPVNGAALNNYGSKDGNETRGVDNVTVTLSWDGGSSTATTDSSGNWDATPGAYPVRVEFSAWPDYLHSSPNGTNSNTSVRFLNASDCSVDFGLHYPGEYFSTANPDVVVPMFISGNPLGGGDAATDPVLRLHPYNLNGTSNAGSPSFTYANVSDLAIGSQIGATWGVAYNRSEQKLYAAATVKRHTGLGSQGLGGIYQVDYSSGSPVVGNFVDVASIGINIGNVDSNTARGLPADKAVNSCDAGVLSQVGKVGIGGIDVSDSDEFLWFTNLYDRKLYKIPTNNPTAGNSLGFDLPNYSCANGELRPWAVTYYENQVYVGAVCTAENGGDRDDLKAVVFAFDDTANSFNSTPVLEFDLNYTKGCANRYSTAWHSACGDSDRVNNSWNPWTDDPNNTTAFGAVLTSSNAETFALTTYPAPIFADIAFDEFGMMNIGLLDRHGNLTGHRNEHPSCDANNLLDPRLYSGVTGGDFLRAQRLGVASWGLENNANDGLVISGGAGNSQGPGGGEFFFEELREDSGGTLRHEETSYGGVLVVPGSREVMLSIMDPKALDSGGTKVFSSTGASAGEGVRSVELYFDDGRSAYTFGKANGVGDIEALSEPAPIEIGNLVWQDDNSNGVQDPNEPLLDGVTVTLHDMNDSGSQVGSATTANGGQYYFGGSSNINMTSGSLLFNRSYEVRVTLASVQAVNSALTGASAANSGSNDLHDSDGVFDGTTSVVAFATGAAGHNNHTYDFGFLTAVAEVDLALMKAVSKTSASPGETLTYTLTVSNLSAVDATGVEVSDVLPAGMTFQSANGDGSYDANSGIWTIGDLAGNSNKVLNIVVVVD